MKIRRICISNVLAVRSFEIEPSEPIQIFCGANGVGKSSVANSVAMAFTGAPARLSMKKELAELVTEGEKKGMAAVEFDGGRATFTLPAGKHGVEGAVPAHLPFILDPEAFAKLDATERRAMLFDLLGVKAAPDDIAARLAARGCNAEKVGIVKPMLASGFDAAAKKAADEATGARGAWRAVTGESYGEKKAEGWAAPDPGLFDEAELAAERAGFDESVAAIEAANQELGALRAQSRQAAEQAGRRAGLEEKAAKIERIRDKLERDQAELDLWSGKLAALPPKPGAAVARTPLACPDCGTALILDGGALARYEAPKADDADTATRRKQWEDAVALYGRSVEHGKRDLAEAQAAAAALKELGDAAAAPADSAVSDLEQRIAGLKAKRDHHNAAITEMDGRQRAAATAAQRTRDAARHHEDAQQWAALAAALSPDGVPAEFVADALEPFNRLLAQYALSAQWAVPRIDQDMTIRFGGRRRELLSKSEKWRLDALLAAAISHFGGVRLLVLDEFDILDLQGREDLILWLCDLVDAGAVDSCLLFGTLKSPPTGLPEHCASHWIERGRAAAQADLLAA